MNLLDALAALMYGAAGLTAVATIAVIVELFRRPHREHNAFAEERLQALDAETRMALALYRAWRLGLVDVTPRGGKGQLIVTNEGCLVLVGDGSGERLYCLRGVEEE